MHCALYYRIRRLRMHGVQQNVNYFIASGTKDRRTTQNQDGCQIGYNRQSMPRCFLRNEDSNRVEFFAERIVYDGYHTVQKLSGAVQT
jgi:hypothetical protein